METTPRKKVDVQKCLDVYYKLVDGYQDALSRDRDERGPFDAKDLEWVNFIWGAEVVLVAVVWGCLAYWFYNHWKRWPIPGRLFVVFFPYVLLIVAGLFKKQSTKLLGYLAVQFYVDFLIKIHMQSRLKRAMARFSEIAATKRKLDDDGKAISHAAGTLKDWLETQRTFKDLFNISLPPILVSTLASYGIQEPKTIPLTFALTSLPIVTLVCLPGFKAKRKRLLQSCEGSIYRLETELYAELNLKKRKEAPLDLLLWVSASILVPLAVILIVVFGFYYDSAKHRFDSLSLHDLLPSFGFDFLFLAIGYVSLTRAITVWRQRLELHDI